jgi:hypothetical protein
MFTTAPEPTERVLSNDEALNELSRKLKNMLKYNYNFEHCVYDFPLEGNQKPYWKQARRKVTAKFSCKCCRKTFVSILGTC